MSLILSITAGVLFAAALGLLINVLQLVNVADGELVRLQTTSRELSQALLVEKQKKKSDEKGATELANELEQLSAEYDSLLENMKQIRQKAIDYYYVVNDYPATGNDQMWVLTVSVDQRRMGRTQNIIWANGNVLPHRKFVVWAPDQTMAESRILQRYNFNEAYMVVSALPLDPEKLERA